MEGMLKSGTELTSECGNRYKVVKLLGSGGQGEVYEVSGGNDRYALKWYYKNSATNDQKKILDRLIEQGSPTRNLYDANGIKQDLFLWPIDLIFEKEGEPFGYIMELRDPEYKGIMDLMKCRVSPSFNVLCRACFNLSKGYKKLHEKGSQYRDINWGNAFFNPENGNVKICDNDNVTPNGFKIGGIKGTPSFMAPELERGDKGVSPSMQTDFYSLSVLLFLMLMVSHPLDGKNEVSIKCMDDIARKRLYGDHPVFIFDPNNDENRPVQGIHDNAFIFWEIYPEYIKKLFIQAFTEGLNMPGRRIPETQWMDALARMISGIIICPSCGQENFYDETKDERKGKTGHYCWCCQKKIPTGSNIIVGKGYKKTIIPISRNTKIYSHQINSDFDIDTVVGEIAINPNDPKKWGIRNKTKNNWTYIRADGTQIPIASGRAAAIARGAKIDFGAVEASFE